MTKTLDSKVRRLVTLGRPDILSTLYDAKFITYSVFERSVQEATLNALTHSLEDATAYAQLNRPERVEKILEASKRYARKSRVEFPYNKSGEILMQAYRNAFDELVNTAIHRSLNGYSDEPIDSLLKEAAKVAEKGGFDPKFDTHFSSFKDITRTRLIATSRAETYRSIFYTFHRSTHDDEFDEVNDIKLARADEAGLDKKTADTIRRSLARFVKQPFRNPAPHLNLEYLDREEYLRYTRMR